MSFDATNLDGMSIPELQSLAEAAQNRIEELREKELEDARKKMDETAAELAKKLGVSKAELLRGVGRSGSRRGRRTASAKFRNPSNSSQTWTGRGRKPGWVQEHLSGGGKLEELAV